MRLSLYRFETGVETIGGNRVVYDLERGHARFGAAVVDGPALVWQLDPAEAVNSDDQLVAAFLQPADEHVAVHFIVFDEQEFGHGREAESGRSDCVALRSGMGRCSCRGGA